LDAPAVAAPGVTPAETVPLIEEPAAHFENDVEIVEKNCGLKSAVGPFENSVYTTFGSLISIFLDIKSQIWCYF